MYKQIGFHELVSAIQKKVKSKTAYPCYDAVEKNTPSPFYFVQVTGKRPAHSKTMWKDTFIVWIHAIAAPAESSLFVYEMIQKLEEALTEDIELPEGYQLVMQMNNGVQSVQTDETGEKHAVLAYEFTVCYGYKMKV